MVEVEEKSHIKKEVFESLVLTKPGQRYATPTPGVAERIFYESLYHQMPESPMAQEYCVLYGILPEDEAARVYKQLQARKANGGGKAGFSPSPAKKKSSSNGNKGEGGNGKKSKAKSRVEDDIAGGTGK